MKTLIFLCLSLHANFSFASAAGCFGLMSSLQSVDGSLTYLNLIKHLVKEKNAISGLALREMSEQQSIPNAMDFISASLSSEDRYAFKKAFDSIKNVNWESVREKLKNLAEDSKEDENKRQGARDNTRFIYAPIPISTIIENREFGAREFFQSSGGLAFIGYEPTKGTYFIDLKTNRQRLINTSSEPVTFLKMKNGLDIIARNTIKGDIFIEEALSGKGIASLNIKDLFPNFPTDKLFDVDIKLFEGADGSLRVVGEIAKRPGLRGVFDLSSHHGYFISANLAPGTGLYTLQDGTILRHKSGWTEELEVTELSEDLPFSKTLLTVGLPPELSDPTMEKWGRTMKGKFFRLDDGRTPYVAHNVRGFGIYDLRNPQPQFVRYDEPQILSDLSELIDVEGSLKLMDFGSRGSDLELRILDLDGTVQKNYFETSGNVAFPVTFHLQNGKALVALPSIYNFNNNVRIKDIQIVDLSTGRAKKILLVGQKVSGLKAIQELDDGRIVGFFLTNGDNIVPLQLYGPVPEGGK